jgi:hypothetical protein
MEFIAPRAHDRERFMGLSGANAMTETSYMRACAILRRRILIPVVLGVALLVLLAGTRPIGAAESGPVNQCVACHTDAAKLKALTPPDPPPSEAGEG